jgi:hypothetical protein
VIAQWSAPAPDGQFSDELLLKFDQDRAQRVVILPALLDEANKMRRLTVATMRLLDAAGIDSFLPDLPGCNESLAPIEQQSLASWRRAARSAIEQVSATHILAIRGGAMLAPAEMPGWRYAPLAASKQLRAMLRAQVLAAKEAGREESTASLMETGKDEGLTLSGWQLSAKMIADLASEELMEGPTQAEIEQSSLGSAGLWLRAEPDHDPAQAKALAGLIATELVSR